MRQSRSSWSRPSNSFRRLSSRGSLCRSDCWLITGKFDPHLRKTVLSGPQSAAGFSFADLFSGNSKRSLALDAKLACFEVGKTRLPFHAGDSETSRNLPPHG